MLGPCYANECLLAKGIETQAVGAEVVVVVVVVQNDSIRQRRGSSHERYCKSWGKRTAEQSPFELPLSGRRESFQAGIVSGGNVAQDKKECDDEEIRRQDWSTGT